MLLLVATAACLFSYVFIFTHETLFKFLLMFLRKIDDVELDDRPLDTNYPTVLQSIKAVYIFVFTNVLTLWDILTMSL